MGNDSLARQIRITGVTKSTKESIKNIAAHIGIDMSSLLKSELPGIIAKYPDHMKIPPPKD